MNILLTSIGISNKSLARALKGLIKGEIKIAFIPTASNVIEGDKSWLIKSYTNAQKLGSVDIVDISALDKSIWLPRLQAANAIFVGGGDPTYLINCVRKSGFDKELPQLLKSRVYVGMSAGSLILSKEVLANGEDIYDDEAPNPPKGLGLIEFNIRPHLNSKMFPKVREKNLKEIAKKVNGKLYALDDESGVLYNDGKIEVISEGKHQVYN
jgi:dipeptidase E